MCNEEKLKAYLALVNTLLQAMTRDQKNQRAMVHSETIYLVESVEMVAQKASPRLDEGPTEVQDPLIEVNLRIDTEPKPVYISGKLATEEQERMIELLHKFKDCFAWTYEELTSLLRGLVEHQLPIKKGFAPTNSRLGGPQKSY